MSDVQPIVFVVDEDAAVRKSVERLVQSAGWQSEVFGSALEFLARPRPDAPCCLVLDVRLPDLDGLELQARVAAARDEMPVIFIASCRDVATTVRAMKAGAVDFLTKPFDAAELLSAIRYAIDRSRATVVCKADLCALREQHGSLTAREREVMALVVSGRMNKQVGGELGISVITVKSHRGKVMRKMEADSLAQLVDMATLLGLTRLPKVNTSMSGRRAELARLSFRRQGLGGLAATAA